MLRFLALAVVILEMASADCKDDSADWCTAAKEVDDPYYNAENCTPEAIVEGCTRWKDTEQKY